MTSDELARMVTVANDFEHLIRDVWSNANESLSEREAALRTLRLIVPLRSSVEAWIVRRACQAPIERTG